MNQLSSSIFYFLIFLVSFLLSCSTDKHEVFEEYYENGNRKYMAEVKNGLLDGLATSFHPNGMVQAEIMYQNDIQHGQTRIYNEKGTLLVISDYNKGVIDGISRTYDDQGRLVLSATYQNGQKIGIEVIPDYEKKTVRKNYYDKTGKLYYYESRGEGNKKLGSILIPYLKSSGDTIRLGETYQVDITLPTPLKGKTFLLIKRAGEVAEVDTVKLINNKLFTYKIKPTKLGENSLKGKFIHLKHKEDTTTVNNLTFTSTYYTVLK